MHPTTTPHQPFGSPSPLPPPAGRRSRGGVVLAVVGGVVALLSAAGAALALLGFFSPVVARADVASGISSQLAGKGVTATAVDCPQDLPAEVGESVRCTYTVDGRAVGVSARVSSVQGDRVVFDTTSEAPLVAATDVAGAVDERVAALGYGSGGRDSATSCPGALIGEIGRSVRCEFVVGGQPVDAVATVSAVTAAEAEFDIALEARPVAQDLLEQDVAHLVSQEYDAVVDTTDCDGGLDAEVGDSTLCTLTDGTDRLDLRVSVSEVEDGLVVYDLRSA